MMRVCEGSALVGNRGKLWYKKTYGGTTLQAFVRSENELKIENRLGENKEGFRVKNGGLLEIENYFGLVDCDCMEEAQRVRWLVG